MFTGLIEHVGHVSRLIPSPAGIRLEIDPRGWRHHPAPGESIAINGCCLTIADAAASTGGPLAFDVIPETLARTTLGRLAAGSRVNLEKSATPSTLLGGHLVQGHIEGLGVIAGIDTQNGWRVRIEVSPDLHECITPKGSIAVEGVSLTVAAVGSGVADCRQPAPSGWFEVALIPTTLSMTTLGDWQAGDHVNIETDIVGRTVIHWLKNTRRSP